MVPMQNSFAHKKERGTSNTNINSADSSSTSTATASNTNNITNTNTQDQIQGQNACILVRECTAAGTEGPVLCPHEPYIDFVAGTGCQDGAPQTICNPSKIADQPATPTDGRCTATLPGDAPTPQLTAFIAECQAAPNGDLGPSGGKKLRVHSMQHQPVLILWDQHKPRQ